MTTNNATTIALPQKLRGTATVYNDLTGGQARCDETKLLRPLSVILCHFYP